LIKEGKVRSVRAEEDDLILNLEQTSRLPILKARWSPYELRRENIQIFGGSKCQAP